MGEADDFDAIFRREWAPVFRLAVALTNDWDEAWDLSQDAFRRVWEARTRIDWERPARPLLLVTVRRLATDRFRRLRRRMTARLDRHATGGPVDADDRVRWLDLTAELGRLLPTERAVIVLVGVNGSSYREAADVLGISEGAARALMSRARSKLRETR